MSSDPTEDELSLAQQIIEEKLIYKIKDENLNGYTVQSMERKDEYYLVVLPRFCTCTQFQIKCLQIPGKLCKHILAVKKAKGIRKTYKGDWRVLLYGPEVNPEE